MDLKLKWPVLDIPLSLALGKPSYIWSQTALGRLNNLNRDSFYIDTFFGYDYESDDYVWRVVDAFLTGEDTNITRFWCYDNEGNPVAHPSILVEWTGGKYSPVDSQFVTVNTSGYRAKVDSDWPSETFHFGHIVKDGNKGIAHDCVVVVWKLVSKQEYKDMKNKGIFR